MQRPKAELPWRPPSKTRTGARMLALPKCFPITNSGEGSRDGGRPLGMHRSDLIGLQKALTGQLRASLISGLMESQVQSQRGQYPGGFGLGPNNRLSTK